MKFALITAVFAFTFTLAAAPQTAEEKIETKAAAQAPKIKPDKIVPYRGDDNNKLYLNCFFPKDFKTTDKRPLVIFFHGGGWSAGAPEQFFLHSRYCNDKGYVAINPSYRLGKTGDDIYNAVADAKSAVRFIRQNAAQFGIDPDHIVFAGSSAGAHLSLAAMLADEVNNPDDDKTISTMPKGIILFCPVVNCGPEGYAPSYRRLQNRYPAVSPAHLLRENMPPMIILLGDLDTALPTKKAYDFVEAVKAKGGTCDLVLFTGLKHGAFYAEKNFALAVPAVNRFLDKNLPIAK